MLHSIFRKVGKEIENNEGRQQYCVQYYLQAVHTAQGVPTSLILGRAHPLLSTSQGYYIFTPFSFNLLFGTFFVLFSFPYILILKSQYTGAVVPLAMFELCSSSFKCICITIFSHIFPFNIWHIVFSNSCIYFA